MSKGETVARDFYPFVEDGQTQGEGSCVVRQPARIAVYDDATAAPRVVVVDVNEVRAYLEEITATVAKLAREQGGSVPFMVIREIVENFIHAYFQAPTISILDGGNTIRFSDRGPGIREKDRALEFGTSSATEEMKHYIRGVGSGLPYVQQYMEDKGGSLEIEDNIDGGTVVTISTRPRDEARAVSGGHGAEDGSERGREQTPSGRPLYGFMPSQAEQAYQMGGALPPSPQTVGYPSPGYPLWGAPQQPRPWGIQGQQMWAPAQADLDVAAQQMAQAPQMGQQTERVAPLPAIRLDERGSQALSYLAERGEAGPTDLVRAFGSSAATWSRALSSMAAQGLVTKVGQKYQLTGVGRALA